MEKKEKCPKCGEWCEPTKRGILDKVSDRGIARTFIDGLIGGAGGAATAIASMDDYVYRCSKCGYEWTATSGEVELDEDEKNENLGDIFDEYCEAFDNETDLEKKISIMQKALSEFDDDDWPTGRAYYWISYCYFRLSNMTKALEYNTKGLKCNAVEYGDDIYGDLCYMRYNILYTVYGEDYKCDNPEVLSMVREFALLASRFADDEKVLKVEDDGYELTERKDASRDFDALDQEYTEKFLELPYKDRKTLLIVDEYEDLCQDHFVTLNINSDLSNLSFPIGHPKVNEMYVAHPMATNRYMPIENYQLELIEDRVREFCELAQHLGATEINIECLNSNDNDSTNSGSRNISGGVSKGSVGVSGSYHDEYSRRLIEKISRSVSLHQTFHPTKTPELPDSLIWYNGEPSWQRLYRQRIEGGLLTHEERIETSKSQVVDNREMKAIKAELETLYVNMNMEFDKTEESKFEQQENAVLAISVKFAPLSELTGPSTTQNSQNMGLSANEQKYIEEVKECLADGEIGKTGRKLLNMTREQLGISEARAAELEASVVAPQLTDEEKEYLETYREACADGKISDGERRMLDRYRSKLGISESRAKEIERMA